MTELRALTGARGFAAWFVVLYHIRLSIAGLPPTFRDVFAKGYLAVDFFFLLSGFVIWLTWHERLRERGAVRVFLHRRIARIWPLHLVVLAGAVALASLLAATGHPDPQSFPFAELPLHVVLIQTWGLTDRLAWNDPAWSISAELAAYLLFPLLVLGVDWRRLPGPALLAIATALLVGLHLTMRHEPGLGSDIPRFGVLRCLVEFAVGSIVCAMWLRRWRAGTGAAVAGAVALALLWRSGAPETLVAPALFACLLFLLARSAGQRGNPLETRSAHYLGEISYATYLGHFIAWKAFKLAFVTDPAAVPPWSIMAHLLLVMAGSMLLYHLVERPAQRWINVAARAPAPAEPRA